MLDAMSTGHAGSLSTVHAGSPQGAVDRLTGLAQIAAPGLPYDAIVSRLCEAVDLIVQLERLADGRRIISSVAQLTGAGGEFVDQIFTSDGVASAWLSHELMRFPGLTPQP